MTYVGHRSRAVQSPDPVAVIRTAANPVNDEDTQARTTSDPAPILTAAKLDRTRRFTARPRQAPVITLRDETGRLRVAADGREWADSDGRQQDGWTGVELVPRTTFSLRVRCLERSPRDDSRS